MSPNTSKPKKPEPASGEPYNPLRKENLAESISRAVLAGKVDPMTNLDHIAGAGVYVIYYTGSFPAYAPIAKANRAKDDPFTRPIYVGKAIPEGGRKGGLTKDSSKGRSLRDRLKKHAVSINEVDNLDIADFHVRHLVIDDIWIPLGENMLIETFKPVWNQVIDGYGNNQPGRRRFGQAKSMWDTLHPGRKNWAKNPPSPLSVEFLAKRVGDFLAGRQMDPLPKAVREQLEEAEDDAIEAADEAPL